MEKLIQNGRINKHALRILKGNPHMLKCLIDKTSWAPDYLTLKQRLILVRDNITQYPRCEICAKHVRFVKMGGSEKLSATCSKSCNATRTLKIGHASRSPAWKYNVSRALKQIDPSTNKTIAEMSSIKANETKRARGVKPNALHLHTHEVRLKISQSLKGKPNDAYWKKATEQDKIARLKKIRETREKRGDWLTYEQLTAYTKYAREVIKITRKQDTSHLPGSNFRGRGKNHLDHIVSIKDGFIHNIPAEKIGHVSNLQFISESENCSKQSRSDKNSLLKLLSEL